MVSRYVEYVISLKDFERVKAEIDNPPQPTQELVDLMNKALAWDDEEEATPQPDK